MSETTDTTTPGDPTEDRPEAVSSDQDTATNDTHETDREAAKYRRRLRDTEAERDGLRSRLETLQRAEAERLAADHLADGTDLWLAGAQLADMLDDDGNLDAAKVAETAAQLGTDRPHWRRTVSSAAPAGEVTARGKIEPGPHQPRGWAAVLRGEPVGDTG